MGIGRRKAPDSRQVVDRWMGAVPKFDLSGPPKDWERQHADAHKYMIHALMYAPANSPSTSLRRSVLPVPRQASAHFYRKFDPGVDFYGY